MKMATGKRIKKKLRNTVQISSDSTPLRTGQEIIDREEWKAKHIRTSGIIQYDVNEMYGQGGLIRKQPETHAKIVVDPTFIKEYSKDTFSDYNKENPVWKFIKSTLSNILVTILTGLGMYNKDDTK
jgi:hypothetical protein